MNTTVGIISCHDYDPELVYTALKDAAELAGEPDVAGKTVLLKPNILFDTPPEKATTTHPVFLRAAIRLVRELGAARILVGDSPGFQKGSFSGTVSGLRQVTEEENAVWVNFALGKQELPCPRGRVSRQFTVSDVLGQADCIISLPKLKTHQLMYFTGAMKNLFGLVPSLLKSPYHLKHPSREGFAAMIVDLNTGVMADYALMDGIVGMEGPGPGAGFPRKIGAVLASSNLLALDMAASRIIGYPPLEVPISREALSRGIWLTSPDEIEYAGADIETIRIRDFQKIPVRKHHNQLLELILPRGYRKITEAFVPRPFFLRDTCIHCGDCIRICPADALEFQGRNETLHVKIDYTRCIRCYCCHEICPVKAIEIRRKPLRGLARRKP